MEALKNPIKEINSSLIIKQLRKENEEAAFALNKIGKSGNDSSWYKAKEDIKEFSKKYPDWLFTLYGEGSENGDIWIAYSVNGKQQIEEAKIVIDPFDPKKLK